VSCNSTVRDGFLRGFSADTSNEYVLFVVQTEGHSVIVTVLLFTVYGFQCLHCHVPQVCCFMCHPV